MHVIFVPTNEQARQAAKTVEDRDHFRHRRHLHSIGRNRANCGADHESNCDPCETQSAFQQCGDNGQQHSYRRHDIAATGCLGRAEHFQSDDKKRRRDDVEPLHHFFFFLNIASIRSVTR